MRIIIVGAGAIGGTLAAELSLIKADLLVVARGAHGQAIADKGLRYRTPHSDRYLAMEVVPSIDTLQLRPGDVAILTTKLGDTETAAKSLSQRSSELPVLTLQNGVAGEAMAAQYLKHVYGGMIYLPATYLEAGTVDNYCCNGPGALRLGPIQGDHHEEWQELAALLASAGFNAAMVDPVMPWKYGKLLTNLGNALEVAATDWDNAGPLYARAQAEGQACLAAAGIPYIPVDELIRAASVKIDAIAGQERPGGSMWQSVARKRSPEVDYLNGLIVSLGQQQGVPTPINAMLVRAAWQCAETGRRWTIEELTALAS